MEGSKQRSDILRRILSAVLVAALTIGAAAFPIPKAEAGSDIPDKMMILAGLISALAVAEGVVTAVDKVGEWTEKREELEEEMDKASKENYEADHARLKAADVVFEDMTGEIRSLYAMLASADALSFADSLNRDMFDAQNPGYRNAGAGQYIDFSRIYKDRIGAWKNYAYGMTAASNFEARSILESQSEIRELAEASLSAEGYRQLSEAGSQISNFTNQEMSRLRIAVQRQIEAETKFALNARQERLDVHAAFKQAVREWKSQSTGSGY
jgi:hypothetical protein